METLIIVVLATIIFGPTVLATALYIKRKRNYRKAAAHWERLQRRIDDGYHD